MLPANGDGDGDGDAGQLPLTSAWEAGGRELQFGWSEVGFPARGGGGGTVTLNNAAYQARNRPPRGSPGRGRQGAERGCRAASAPPSHGEPAPNYRAGTGRGRVWRGSPGLAQPQGRAGLQPAGPPRALAAAWEFWGTHVAAEPSPKSTSKFKIQHTSLTPANKPRPMSPRCLFYNADLNYTLQVHLLTVFLK